MGYEYSGGDMPLHQLPPEGPQASASGLLSLLSRFLPASVLRRLKAVVPLAAGIAGVLASYYGAHSAVGAVSTGIVAVATAIGVYAVPNEKP